MSAVGILLNISSQGYSERHPEARSLRSRMGR